MTFKTILKFLPCLAALASCMVILACGDDDSTSSTDPVTLTSLTGTWQSECFDRSSLSQTVSFSFTAEGAYSIETKSFAQGTECVEAGLLMTINESGASVIGDDLGGGVTEMDNTIAAISITPANANGLAVAQGACSQVEGSEISSSLAVGTASSLIADSCRLAFMSPAYTIGQISGSNFFSGDIETDATKNGFTEEARPTEISSAVAFAKQ